jgi:hypothetical protein
MIMAIAILFTLVALLTFSNAPTSSSNPITGFGQSDSSTGEFQDKLNAELLNPVNSIEAKAVLLINSYSDCSANVLDAGFDSFT